MGILHTLCIAKESSLFNPLPSAEFTFTPHRPPIILHNVHLQCPNIFMIIIVVCCFTVNILIHTLMMLPLSEVGGVTGLAFPVEGVKGPVGVS
jgi:hypothetical protein